MAIPSYRYQGRTNQFIDQMLSTARYLGVFPFKLNRDGIQLIPIALFTSIGTLVIGIVSVPSVWRHLEGMMIIFGTSSFNIVYIIPYLSLVTVVVVHIVWLLLEKERLQKIFKAIATVEDATQLTPETSGRPMSILMCGLLLGFSFGVLEFGKSILTDGNFIIFVLDILVLSIVSEFVSLLDLLGHLFDQVSVHFQVECIDKWVDCHELLVQCCVWLCHCYSPQLTIVFMSNFIYIVSNSYVMISAFRMNKATSSVGFIYWLLFNWMQNAYVVFYCSTTKRKVKNTKKHVDHNKL